MEAMGRRPVPAGLGALQALKAQGPPARAGLPGLEVPGFLPIAHQVLPG